MKVYRGAAAGARLYVEHDRSRADDYYLAEGTGIARRFAATADGRVMELQVMDGDAYESWVSGFDPATGQPRGRLRNDKHAVRFVEVTVNGPKSWSIAAELHPDVAVAYEAAQDRAAAQITGWLAGNATARVGPRGAQVAAPVELIEAATIRHYTSRAGDPHRHLHLQINSRVLADGKWRGIDTVAVRDSLNAINGIGHAAVVCDPEFRAALSRYGYTLNTTGEIEQLAPFVGPFSKRAAQIEANIDRYEREWTKAHPNEQPGPGLRRAWDARAWAEGRPDKVIPEPGAEVQARWVAELVALGYRDDDRPIQLALPLAGQIDRDGASSEIVLRLGAARSSWNAADVRGDVEHLLARAALVADAAVRRELAEDLTARALADSVPLMDREVPAHVRALTAQHVLDVEADLVGRLAVRGAEPCEPLEVVGVAPAGCPLDDAQAAAVAVLAGTAPLVVIEGAAGAGKTTTLSLTRRLLDGQGRWLVVVTPTLKAAHVAAAELGTQAGSAAWLAHQYGWRWDDTGRWTRLRPLDTDPATGRQYLAPTRAATLRRGDLLLVDEAAMLDQDTARALLTIADEHGARFALVGDRHQLPAVGRGGVLDLAHRWADPTTCVTLDQVHRFTDTAIIDWKPATVADIEYAQLTLAMRGGDAPEGLFEALHNRGQVRIHPTEADRLADVADTAVAQRRAGRSCAVVVDTREQAARLNTAIRDRLIAAGVVDDRQGTNAAGGERVGVGDTVATRRNDCDLGVANRDTWTVAAVHADGSLTVGRPGANQRQLPAGYVRAHVELAYATTAHGAQGDTTTTAHLILGEHTSAAAAYVGMTRGREGNIAHLVAADLDEARQQWSAAFGRDRADLGPAHAREAAERDAAGYAPPAPRPDPAAHAARLDAVLAELAAAWTDQQNAHLTLTHRQHKLDGAQRDADRRDAYEAIVGRARTDMISRRKLAEQATRLGEASRVTLRAAAEQLGAELHALWDADRKVAGDAARTVAAGPGRLRQRRGQIRDARELLDTWAEKWRPVLDVTAGSGGAAGFAICHPGNDRVEEPLTAYVRTLAEAQCPHDAVIVRTAVQLRDAARAAADRYGQAVKRADETIARDHGHGYYPRADDLPDLTDRARQAQQRADAADARVDRLIGDPALASQPDPSGFLASAHNRWAVARDAALTAAAQRARLADATRIVTPDRFHRDQFDPPATVEHGPSMGR